MDSDEINYKYLYNLAKNNVLFIALVFIVLFFAIVAITLVLPKIYESTATVIIGSNENVDREVALINKYLEESFIDKYNNAVTYNIGSSKNAKSLEIKAEARNPQMAQDAANDLMYYYLDFANVTRMQRANATIDDLQKQIDNIKNELSTLYIKRDNYKNQSSLNENEKKDYNLVLKSIDTNEKLVNALPYKKAEFLKQAIENIHSISFLPASLPVKFTKPNFIYNLGMGAFISLFLAFLLAQVKESLKTSKSHSKK